MTTERFFHYAIAAFAVFATIIAICLLPLSLIIIAIKHLRQKKWIHNHHWHFTWHKHHATHS